MAAPGLLKAGMCLPQRDCQSHQQLQERQRTVLHVARAVHGAMEGASRAWGCGPGQAHEEGMMGGCPGAGGSG